jgi:hypothetical protein
MGACTYAIMFRRSISDIAISQCHKPTTHVLPTARIHHCPLQIAPCTPHRAAALCEPPGPGSLMPASDRPEDEGSTAGGLAWPMHPVPLLLRLYGAIRHGDSGRRGVAGPGAAAWVAATGCCAAARQILEDIASVCAALPASGPRAALLAQQGGLSGGAAPDWVQEAASGVRAAETPTNCLGRGARLAGVLRTAEPGALKSRGLGAACMRLMAIYNAPKAHLLLSDPHSSLAVQAQPSAGWSQTSLLPAPHALCARYGARWPGPAICCIWEDRDGSDNCIGNQ